MHNLKVIRYISRLQWRKSLHRTQFWLVVILVPLLAYRYMQPVLRFVTATGVNATPVGLTFFLSDYGLSFVVTLGLLMLFSQAPFMDEQMTFVLLRCDNRKWYMGSILYCMETAFFYVLYWCACLLLPLIGKLNLTMEWGKIWTTLCRTDAYFDYRILVKMPYGLLAYDGWQALIYSITLKGTFCMLIVSIIFTGNMIKRIPIGSVVSVLMLLQDYFAMNGHGFAYYWYSPSTMSRLSMLDSTNTFLQPSMWEAFGVLMTATILVQLLGIWAVGKTEIHKTSSRE